MIKKILHTIHFLGLYLFQLLRSNILLAQITLSPKLSFKYGFIKIPINFKSDFGILLFSNLVSMTPGSLVTDIDKNKEMATVHVIFSSDEDELIEELERMQTRIKRITE